MAYFHGDVYHTPPNTPRSWGDKLAGNSRGYFLLRYMAALLHARIWVSQGKYDRTHWAKSSYNLFRIIEDCGGRFHITGLDNLRALQGPVVMVSNHMGTLEANVYPVLIDPIVPVTFVVKESAIRYPLFGPVVKATNPIPVGRANPREDFQIVLNEGKAAITAGKSVMVFPQSTRSTQFFPEQFNSIGVKLAKRANVPVLPVALKTDFWQMGEKMRDFGPLDRTQPIHFAFGKPIESYNQKEAHQRCIAYIQEQVTQWQT